MSEDHAAIETLREELAMMRATRALERKRYESAEQLARSLAALTASYCPTELLVRAASMFAEALGAESVVVLKGSPNEPMTLAASSGRDLGLSSWPHDQLTARVLAGTPTLVVRCDRHPAWAALSEDVRARAGSALHMRVGGGNPAALFIAVHSERGYFRHEHVERIKLIAGPIEDAWRRALAVEREGRLLREAETANQRLQEAQIELLAARNAAQEASRAKSAFLARMSHELRTPLAGVIGLTELVLGEPLPDDTRRLVNAARTSAEHLLLILNDILDLSKIEAGKMTLECVPLDLIELMDQVRLFAAVRAQEKGLAVDTHVDLGDKRVRRGDPLRLKQILLNLVSNALKFTERGSISIDVQAQDDDMVRFAVLDTGPGIPPDRREAIFEPFSQVDGSISRRYGGTGLGLPICRELVTMFGGRIWVECGEDFGSRFTFLAKLPAAEGSVLAADSAPFEASTPLGRLRVLVAEDNPVNQLVVERLLRRLGHTPVIVGNGRAAVDIVAKEAFDIILMDVSMPEMNGLEAASRIRMLPSPPPIVALTANAMMGDREQCLEAGMDGYLAKPVRETSLVDTLERFARPSAAR